MTFSNELVLSFVQPFLKVSTDHANSQLVSKYLNKTGSENPLRPKSPFGYKLALKRKRKDKKRLMKHASKLEIKQIYLEEELPKIHEELLKLRCCDVMNEYVEGSSVEVKCGIYIPVMYPNQRKPIWSLIYAAKKHSVEEANYFLKELERLRIYGVFHGGLDDEVVESSKALIKRPGIKNHPNYTRFLSESKSPCPFQWYTSTLYYRWIDASSNKMRVITYG